MLKYQVGDFKMVVALFLNYYTYSFKCCSRDRFKNFCDFELPADRVISTFWIQTCQEKTGFKND